MARLTSISAGPPKTRSHPAFTGLHQFLPDFRGPNPGTNYVVPRVNPVTVFCILSVDNFLLQTYLNGRIVNLKLLIEREQFRQIRVNNPALLSSLASALIGAG